MDDKVDHDSRVPGLWVASTDSDAVLDVLVVDEDPGEPREAPEELNLAPDGAASVNHTQSQFEHELGENNSLCSG